MGKKGKQRNTSNSSDGGGLGASAAPSPFVFSASPDAGGPSSHSQGQTPAWAVRFQKQSPEVLKIAQRMEAGLDLGSPDVPHLPGERLPPVDKWDPIHAFSALDIALSPDRMERFRDSWDFGPMAPSSWAPYWAMRGALDWMSYRHKGENPCGASLQTITARKAAILLVPDAQELLDRITMLQSGDQRVQTDRASVLRAAEAARYLAASAGAPGPGNRLLSRHPRLLFAMLLDTMVGGTPGYEGLSEQMQEEVCDELMVLMVARELVRTLTATGEPIHVHPDRRRPVWDLYWAALDECYFLNIVARELSCLAACAASWAMVPTMCEMIGSLTYRNKPDIDKLDPLFTDMVTGGLRWPQAKSASRRLFCLGAPMFAEAFSSDRYDRDFSDDFRELLWKIGNHLRHDPGAEEDVEAVHDAVHDVFEIIDSEDMGDYFAVGEVASWDEWIAVSGGEVTELEWDEIDVCGVGDESPAAVVAGLAERLAATELEVGEWEHKAREVKRRRSELRSRLEAAAEEMKSLLTFHRTHISHMLAEAYDAWGLRVVNRYSKEPAICIPERLMEKAQGDCSAMAAPLQQLVKYFQTQSLSTLLIAEGSQLHDVIYGERDWDLEAEIAYWHPTALCLILLRFFNGPESGCDQQTAGQVLLYLEQDLNLPIRAIQSLQRRLKQQELEADSTLTRMLLFADQQ